MPAQRPAAGRGGWPGSGRSAGSRVFWGARWRSVWVARCRPAAWVRSRVVRSFPSTSSPSLPQGRAGSVTYLVVVTRFVWRLERHRTPRFRESAKGSCLVFPFPVHKELCCPTPPQWHSLLAARCAPGSSARTQTSSFLERLPGVSPRAGRFPAPLQSARSASPLRGWEPFRRRLDLWPLLVEEHTAQRVSPCR